MTTIELGNIELQIDPEKTRKFYESQIGFTCDCPDCLNYVEKIPVVKTLLNGLDEKLGIDLTKDVGQGMDELMPLDNDDHCLYVIPYYVNGKCRVQGKDLVVQQNGPVWPNTIRSQYQLHENLTLTIINTSNDIEFEKAQSVLTVWVEFKTPLLNKEKITSKDGLWSKLKRLIVRKPVANTD